MCDKLSVATFGSYQSCHFPKLDSRNWCGVVHSDGSNRSHPSEHTPPEWLGCTLSPVPATDTCWHLPTPSPAPSPLPPSSLPAPTTQQTVVLLSWESPLFGLTLVLTPVGHQSSFPSGNLSTLKCLPSFCVKILDIKPISFSIAVPLYVCGLRLQILFHNLSAGRKHTASKKCGRPLGRWFQRNRKNYTAALKCVVSIWDLVLSFLKDFLFVLDVVPRFWVMFCGVSLSPQDILTYLLPQKK